MLRLPNLEQDYEAAWQKWEASGDQAAWSVTTADGIADAGMSIVRPAVREVGQPLTRCVVLSNVDVVGPMFVTRSVPPVLRSEEAGRDAEQSSRGRPLLRWWRSRGCRPSDVPPSGEARTQAR
ncbi:hypothetical protein GCM10009843_33010 [Nocardioides bigeumensis]|uniref:Uncharacterized protein n=1 Tax=Nocardioides bigeumensis TaxID=433657 RepID=A0ABP5KHC7_9ACTN